MKKETSDKIVQVGTTIATGISLWDRLRGWWHRRKDDQAEKRRMRAASEAERAEHEFQRISDEANRRRGVAECDEPGCERPKFHAGLHGPSLKPWVKR
jgi:hypothetical protein